MWCVPLLDKEYIRRMEDILDLYDRPHCKREPVVCIDEKPVQLLSDVRPSRTNGRDRIRRRDYEYERQGVVNVFCALEPKAARHLRANRICSRLTVPGNELRQRRCAAKGKPPATPASSGAPRGRPILPMDTFNPSRSNPIRCGKVTMGTCSSRYTTTGGWSTSRPSRQTARNAFCQGD